MATNWVDEVLSGATSTGSKTLSLATGNALSVANSSSESIFTVTSDTTNGGYTSILGIEGQEAVLFLGADNADDAGDAWELHSDTSGNFKIGNRTSGTGSPTRSNTFTNALTIDSSRNITVGVDDTGYDVKFFGATSSNYMIYDQSDDMLKVFTTGSSSGSGNLQLVHTDTDALAGPKLMMRRLSNDALNDVLGSITFTGDDDGDGETAYATVRGQVGASSGAMAAGAEEGALNLITLANGSEASGIIIKGQADGTVDVDIGYGAASVTTIKGDLVITGGNITSALTCDSTVTTTGLLTAAAGVKLGNNIIYASDGNATITLDTSDNTTFTNDIVLADTKKLRLDGSTSGDTYIMGNGADVLDIVVGNQTMMKFTESSSETIACDADSFEISTSVAGYNPTIKLIDNEVDDGSSTPPQILFHKAGAEAQDGDKIGRIGFKAIADDGGSTSGVGNTESFAYIQGEVVDSVAASEAGRITWHIFSDSSDVTAMTLAGNATDSRCELSLGADGAGCDFKAFGESTDSYMQWDQSADKLRIVTANDSEALRLKSIESGASAGPTIGLVRDGSSVADGDDIGAVNFIGEDNGGTEHRYGSIGGEIITKADDANEGRVSISVSNHNGSGTNAQNAGLKVEGKDDSTVNVVLAYGATSTTTVRGDLAVTGGNITITGAPSYTATTQTARNADTATTIGPLQDVVQTLIDDLQDIGILQ